MPASMLLFDGLRIDPEVSVPTLAAQKLAAVPMPELEPPVPSAGRPSSGRTGRPPSRAVGRTRFGAAGSPARSFGPAGFGAAGPAGGVVLVLGSRRGS